MKKVLLFTMAAAAFVSCSRDELSEPMVNDGTLIALKSVAYSVNGSTRAPFEGAISSTNALKVWVPSSATPGNYTTTHAVGTMTFNSPTTAATYDLPLLSGTTGSESFPTDPAQVYLFGGYPATGWALTTEGESAGKAAAFTFTGKEDVMAAPEVIITKDSVSKGLFETLAFKHLLTKLEVKFKAEAVALSVVGTIKSVKWVADATGTDDLLNKVTFAPVGTASFAKADPVAKSLSFYSVTETGGTKTYTNTAYSNESYPLTTTSTLQAYAMVAPVTASASKTDEYFIEVVRVVGAGEKKDYIPFDLMKEDNTTPFDVNTAGYSFTVVVNYTKDDIKAIATVADWKNGGEYVAETPVSPAS